MIVPDLNLLLYAYNSTAPQHREACVWWESVLNGRELVGMPHEVMLGFIRIATNPRLGQATVPLTVAKQVVAVWQTAPVLRIILPQVDHTEKVIQLLERSQSSGQLTSDASLAVYAIENRAVLCSNDSDFARFPGLDWTNPLNNRG